MGLSRSGKGLRRLLFHDTFCPGGLFRFTTRLRLVECNDRFLRIVKTAARSPRGFNLGSLEEQGFLSALRAACEGKEGAYEGTYRDAADSTQVRVSLRTASIRGAVGRIIGGLGIIFDVDGETDLALKRRLEFEKVIVEIFYRFVSARDLGQAIEASLSDIGTMSGMSRAYVLELRDDGVTLDNTHEWCAPGVASYLQKLQNIPVSAFQWLIEKLRNAEVVRIDDVSLLPPEAAPERAEFERKGIKSLLMLPLNIGGRFAGCIGMEKGSGFVIWSEENLSLMRVFSETLACAVGRARSLEALRHSEERFRGIFDNAYDMIQIIDPEGRFLFVNPAWLRVMGYAREELEGKNIEEFLHESSKETYSLCMRKVLEGGWVDGISLKLLTRSGLPVDIEGTATGYRPTGLPVSIVGIMRDVTEQRKLETQLRHAQKMESLGTLTGGIAHDFNNILQAIISYGQFLLMKMKDNEPLRRSVEQILVSSSRAANLTKSLLAFSRKQANSPMPVDLNEIVRGVDMLISGLLGEDITLDMSLTGDEMTVIADHAQIEQTLVNLCTNARDAMPFGGKLTVSTSRAQLDAAYVRTHRYGEVGMYALLTVSDTGTGMDEATLKRIFEPFFTTKGIGKGTGLGLAIVYGIIKQHGGNIDCYSEPGIGTTFKIYLPLANVKASSAAGGEAPSFMRGMETVLLAEDELEVRAVTRQILEDSGYTVIEASNGEEAVRRFREGAERIDLLVFDLIMPKLNGREAYEIIRTIKPGVKALFYSGYPADFIREKTILGEKMDFISKPVPPSALLRKMRDMLDDRGK